MLSPTRQLKEKIHQDQRVVWVEEGWSDYISSRRDTLLVPRTPIREFEINAFTNNSPIELVTIDGVGYHYYNDPEAGGRPPGGSHIIGPIYKTIDGNSYQQILVTSKFVTLHQLRFNGIQ